MDSNDIKSYLISAFRYWIITTKLRDLDVYNLFRQKSKNSNAKINEICDIINGTLLWADTPLGYDDCCIANFEWSVFSILLYERFIQQNKVERYIGMTKDEFEQRMHNIFCGALTRYRNCGAWGDRKKTHSAVMVRMLFGQLPTS